MGATGPQAAFAFVDFVREPHYPEYDAIAGRIKDVTGSRVELTFNYGLYYDGERIGRVVARRTVDLPDDADAAMDFLFGINGLYLTVTRKAVKDARERYNDSDWAILFLSMTAHVVG